MSKQIYTPEEARRAKNDSNARYDQENTRQVKFKFNLKTDADVLMKLDSESNMQGYIKRLIREDIARSASES